MKKKISIVVAVIVSFVMMSVGCTAQMYSYPVHVEGALFGGNSSDNIALTLEFDPDWLTEGSVEEYNHQLASFAAVLAADSYFREKDLARGTQNRVLCDGLDASAYEFTTLLQTIGFPVTKHVESYQDETIEFDTSDSVTMNLAYTNAYNDCDIFLVVIRGCFSAGEWNSVFDVGYADDAYTALTGPHPEWTDTQVHKGMDIAANRAMKYVEDFISENDDPDRKNCVLVAGHSRGGCIAQLVGAQLENNPDIESYTYTFNSSVVTDNPEAENYRTIFNICDSHDFFSRVLPFGEEAMYSYGQKLGHDIAASSDILAMISEIKGRDDYQSASVEIMEQYRTLFENRFANREQMYVPRNITENFEDKEAAENCLEEYLSIISSETGLGLETYCQAQMVSDDSGTYTVQVAYYDAVLLQSIGKVLAYGEAAANAVKTLFAQDTAICEITDLLMEHSAQISGGHLIVNSYALTKYDAR